MGGACSTYDESRSVYRVLEGNPEGRRLPGIDWRILLKWIFRKWDVAVWTGLTWLRIGTGGGQF